MSTFIVRMTRYTFNHLQYRLPRHSKHRQRESFCVAIQTILPQKTMNQTKDNSYDNCSLVTNFCQIWKINTKVMYISIIGISVL